MKIFYRFVLVVGVSLAGISGSWAQTNLVISGPMSNTPGNYNTYIGATAGNSSSSAQNNVFVGFNAGSANTTGFANTFTGKSAGEGNTMGYANSFYGYSAGSQTTVGINNTFTGYLSGSLNTSGYSNSFYGVTTGAYITTGYANSFYGEGAGLLSSIGNHNSFFGRQSGGGNGRTDGIQSTFATGSYNCFFGDYAGFNNNNANYNVMLGDSTGANNQGSGNVMVGSRAGRTNQTGQQNTYLGFQSGYNAVADSNTFVGYKSGYSATTGKGNTLFGSLAGQGISTGSHNTIMGNGAGPANGNGDSNVYMGYTTGNHDGGSRNTFLGTGADALAQNLTNATAIGAGAVVSVSDAVVLGKNAKVGIGTDAPTDRLHVRSERADESGFRLENLTSNSPATMRTDKVLTVNERGDVVLAQPKMSKLFVKNQAAWADRVFEPNYVLTPLNEVKQYVKANKHLPDVPSADDVVKNGYDAAKMDAHLLKKVEETMLYVIQLKDGMNLLRQQNKQLKRALQRVKKH